MRAASRLIQIAAFAALFSAYAYVHPATGLSGVRRALQTIGTTVETTVNEALMAAQAA